MKSSKKVSNPAMPFARITCARLGGFMRGSRSMLLSALPLLVLLTVVAVPAFSQDPPSVAMGINPQGTYHSGDFDFVDMASGRLNLHIPVIVDHSQRGKLNFTYSVVYTSTGAWNEVCGVTTCSLHPPQKYGISGPGIAADGLPVDHYTERVPVQDPLGNTHFYYETYVYDDGGYGIGPAHPYAGSANETLDGSGIRGNSIGYADREGVNVALGGLTDPNGIFTEDANGNEITGVTNTTTSTTTLTDTLGRPWTMVSNSSNVSGCPTGGPVAPTTSTTWTVPGPANINSGVRAFKFCYSVYFVNATFPGITGGEQYINNVAMLTGVVLPDGTTWRFDYENNSYGNLTAVYPPTGGHISYTWTTSQSGCSVGDGVAARVVATRTVYDGANSSTWTYNQGSGNNFTVTDPLGNASVYTSGCNVTQIKSYSGSTTSGTLLKTVLKGYRGLPNPFNCDITTGDPDPELLQDITTIWPNGQQSNVHTTYDSGFIFTDGNPNPYYSCNTPTNTYTSTYGLVTSESHSDYGSGAPGPIISTTNTNYLALGNSSYAKANILELPSSVIITDGSGNKCAETDYGYDEYTADASGVTQQHVAAPNSVRGNLTSVTQQLFTSPCSSPTPSETPLKTTKHVYDTGMIHTSTDPKNNPPTIYTYSGTYYGAYPTSVCNPLNQCTTYGYDFNTGLMTSMTDPNNQTTTYPSYDVMLRLLQANFPDNGQTKFIYANPTTVEMQKLMSGTTWTDSFVKYDGLGREIRRISKNDETIPWDQVDTCYDADGRIGFKSYPYQGNGLSAAQVCSGAGDTVGYDPVGRTTSVTHSDGSSILTTYADPNTHLTGRATSVSDEGNGTQKVQRVSQMDGLGRLTSLCEISGSLSVGISGSQTASSCNLDIGGTGFLTNYTYDALNNLKSVSQGPLNPRTFLYDSLSRITQATNPESGTICYGMYSGSACQQNGYDADSNLIYKADARKVTVTYSYDQGDRMIQKSYSDGTTPTYYYSYDVSPPGVSGLTNLVGRLVEAKNQYAGTAGKGVFSIYSYDSIGRVSLQSQQTPATAPNSHSVSYGYNLTGDMTSLVNGLGQTLTYTFNRAQRVTSLSTNTTPFGSAGELLGSTASPVHYNAAGSAVSASLGNGISETRSYDARLRLTGITDGPVYSVIIPANGGYAPNSDILSANDSVNGNWTYAYDAFNRLASANATGQGYTYAYDRFGNRWQQNGPHSSQPGFDANNHIVPGLGVTYDAAGDTTSDGTTAYTYDGESHIATASNSISSSSGYVYDAHGKRVEKTTSSGGTVDFIYDTAGHEIAQMNSSGTWTRGEVYAAGRHVATLNNNTTYYNHGDWLGTERARSTSTGTLFETCTSLAFGDWLTCGGNDPSPMHFTGKEHDNETGLDNFGARYNSSQYGRFMAPDPLQPSQAHPMVLDQFVADPQNWNEYVYSLDNPVTYADVGGHFTGKDHERIQITAMAARGFSQGARDIAASANSSMDKSTWRPGVPAFNHTVSHGTQNELNPQHGERGETQTVEQAKAAADSFMTGTVASAAERALHGDVIGALEDLGKASHTAQDIVRHQFEKGSQHPVFEKDATAAEKIAATKATNDVLDGFIIETYALGMSLGLSYDEVTQDLDSVMQGPAVEPPDSSQSLLGDRFNQTCLAGIRCD